MRDVGFCFTISDAVTHYAERTVLRSAMIGVWRTDQWGEALIDVMEPEAKSVLMLNQRLL